MKTNKNFESINWNQTMMQRYQLTEAPFIPPSSIFNEFSQRHEQANVNLLDETIQFLGGSETKPQIKRKRQEPLGNFIIKKIDEYF